MDTNSEAGWELARQRRESIERTTQQNETPHSVRCRCQPCRTQLLLRAASVRELLTRAYQLTHRMHATEQLAAKARRAAHVEIAREQTAQHDELRAMRELITAEIERRCES